MNTWNSGNIYLPFFHELLTCGQNLYSWVFDRDLQLIEDNSPDSERYSFLFLLKEMGPRLLELGLTEAKPVLVTNSLGVLWLADFEKDDTEALFRVHVVGPLLIDAVSEVKLDKALNKTQIPNRIKWQVQETVRELPILPFTRMIQFSLMLHYTISGEKITTKDLRFLDEASSADSPVDPTSPSWQKGVRAWEREQELLRHVTEGNELDTKHRDRLSLGMQVGKLGSGDNLRQMKNQLIIFTALCMRAALRGGILAETAYELSDRYIQAIEASTQIPEIIEISRVMEEDFTHRVRLAKEAGGISPQIQRCLDYISFHRQQKISVSDLAEQAGYAENYLIVKFKAETGKTISEYIRTEKMEYAKSLLKSTDDPISEIAERLGFATQSHFGKRFRDYTGCSPSEYREKAGFDFAI